MDGARGESVEATALGWVGAHWPGACYCYTNAQLNTLILTGVWRRRSSVEGGACADQSIGNRACPSDQLRENRRRIGVCTVPASPRESHRGL